MKNIFKILFVFFLVSCGGVSQQADQDNKGNSVGTIVNPVNKPSSLTISFQTVGEFQSDCDGDAQKPTCFFTPDSYQLGLMKMWLVNCQNEDMPIFCDRLNAFEIKKTLIYDDEMVDLFFNEESSLFSESLLALEEDVSFSLAQFEVGYIQQTFPKSSAITPKLHGVNYRVCTSSHRIFSKDEMNYFCGVSDAFVGDLLIDLDHDGVFGFLQIADDDFFESEIRPLDYEFRIMSFVKRMASLERSFSDDGSKAHLILTAIQDRELEKQIFSIQETQEIHFSFDITNSASFADKDKDSVYNPIYDGIFHPRLPVIYSEVQE